MIEKILIPKERMPVLIGKDGSVKKRLEEATCTKIEIADDVTVHGEALDAMNACNIIKAIGRGFDPSDAFDLIDENITLCIIPLPNDKKVLKRLRARIIGTHGKCRKSIERLTKTKLSIYGKTASIIGEYEAVDLARCAIERLVSGYTHSNVYSFIEENLSNRSKELPESGI